MSAEGAAHVLDHTTPGYLDEVMKITAGRGADVILEMLANVNLGKDLAVLAPRGRVVVIGSRGTVEINPRDLMTRNADVRGISLNTMVAEDVKAAHAAIAGLRSGILRPIVDEELPLTEAARAHAEVLGGASHGKIVLVP